MIIAVNTRLLLPGKLEGIGRFTDETLKIITAKHPEHRFLFIFDRNFSEAFIYASNITPVICFPPARHPLLWYWFFEHGIPSVLKKHHAEIFLSPDGWLSTRTDVPSLPVIHDLNFVHYPEFIPFHVRKYYHHFFPKFIHKATRIATVSEYTKKDIEAWQHIGETNIDVVFNGARGFAPADERVKAKIREKYTGGAPYFLFVGLIHPRKNLVNLIKAYDLFRAAVPEKVKLVIAGANKWWTSEMENALQSCRYNEDIIFTGRVTEDELPALVASALSMVYVSWFEGFGIPVLESMYADVPVLCSSTTSLPEVAGDAALMADPSDIHAIKSGMIRIYKDPVLRQRLIEKGRLQREKFTWERTADLLWQSVEKCIKDA